MARYRIVFDDGRNDVAERLARDVAERLARDLDDETTRETLAAAVADARNFTDIVRRDEIVAAEVRAARSCERTAARLAAEIVATVAAGEELPEEWHKYDTYADIGEPVAFEVCRLVREELQGTAIRV